MKKLISLIICGLLALTCPLCYAGNSDQHEADLERIFLGQQLAKDSKDPKKNPGRPEVLFGYLEDAIYLCIDQMGGQGQDWLDELNNDFQVEGLPTSINSFNVPEADHEKYTHLGWDYKYYPKPKEWAIRQNILLATVSKVFNFPVDENKSGNDKYTEQCVEMTKLIYYIHILGDHSRNKFASTTDRIQLRNATITRGEVESGLINELRNCISKLFWDQRTSLKYNWLMVKLNVVRFKAWKSGEEDSEEKHQIIMDIAKEVMDYLQPEVRKMLLVIPFYKKVFHEIAVN